MIKKILIIFLALIALISIVQSAMSSCPTTCPYCEMAGTLIYKIEVESQTRGITTIPATTICFYKCMQNHVWICACKH